MKFSLDDLDAMISTRADQSPDSSYTAQLLSKGVKHCAQKLGEEAVETVIAAVAQDKPEITKEAADTLYHLLVLLKVSDVALDDVMVELQSRTIQSGIEEKASR